jgi:hypothetical protein
MALALRVYERLMSYAPSRLAASIDYFLVPALRRSWGGPFNGQKKRAEIVAAIFKAVRFTAVVETGSHRGTTTEFLRRLSGLTVFSVEHARRYFEFSRLRFHDEPAIELHLGDSREFLRALLGNSRIPDGPLFFYLDAHWDADVPVREELRIIAAHRPDVVMMIDDFRVPDDAGYGFDAQYGPGKRLTMEDTGLLELKGMEIFWPAARSSDETGERRGCVVLASGNAIEPLKSLSVLRQAVSAVAEQVRE